METGSMNCIKYLLFIFNLFFFIAGLVFITAGIVIQTRYNEEFAFFEGVSVNYVAILLIAVGLVIFTIGFFGCCGAYKENHCMVLTFAVLLGFVFVVEIGAAITAHIMRHNIDTLIRDTMTKTIVVYPGGTAVTESWDHTQKDLKCCGANNYTDWAENKNLLGSVPDSCCLAELYTEHCGKDVIKTGNTTAIYQEGCANKFLRASTLAVVIIICVAIGIAIIQVTGIVSSCFLARAFRREEEELWTK